MPAGVFAIERISLDGSQRVYAIHNLTGDPVSLDIASLDSASTNWFDALHQTVPDIDTEGLRLRPYQSVWLMPKG